MINAIAIIAAVLALFYALLIGIYIYGWQQLSKQKNNCLRLTAPSATNYIPRTTICVIVPARNEAKRIAACLQSIVAQQYPAKLLEIIAIDDHSTDETAHIIAQFEQVRLLRLSDYLLPDEVLNAYKKKAIETAIAQTKQDLIVSTDADCVLPPTWLASIAQAYEQGNAHIIAAPVQYIEANSFVEQFQSLDIAGMMVATGASLHLRLSAMCNGANLAYRRDTFYEVGGFAGINHLASGDDMLLMAKILERYPKGAIFLQQLSATVGTYAQNTWREFAQQRLRWASKSRSYQDRRITWLLGGVYLFNLSIIASITVGLITQYMPLLYIGLAQFAAKNIIDAVFLGVACRFFKRTDLLWYFFPAQIMHVFYIVIIGTLGNMGVYSWKGRRVR